MERILSEFKELIRNKEKEIKTVVEGDFNARIEREGGRSRREERENRRDRKGEKRYKRCKNK